MKTWWNFQTGIPQAHHATGQVNALMQFSGTAALSINASFARLNVVSTRLAGAGSFANVGVVSLPSFARLGGAATLFADSPAVTRLQAISTFAGAGAILVNTLQVVRTQAIATFGGVATLFAVQGNIQLALATFAGAGSARITNATLFRVAIATFTGIGSSLLNATAPTSRVQAVATFTGASALAANTQQRMLVRTGFAGNAVVRETPQQRFRANSNMAGTGFSNQVATISNLVPLVPLAPIITLLSTAGDSTPDFAIDLPTGAGNYTDALVGDILLIEKSADAGTNWASYFSHTLVPADLTGSTMTGTATALASGSYQFRARLQRSANFSLYSNVITDTIIIPPGAPSITWLSVPTDVTPDFHVDVPSGAGNDTDARVGDIALVQFSSDGGANYINSVFHTLVALDIPSGFNFTATVLANGTYLFRVQLQRLTVVSLFSANITVTINAINSSATAMFLHSASEKGEPQIGGNDVYTKLLLHMDGTDGSQTFIDSSPSNHTMTANHGYRITTTAGKFSASGAPVGNSDDYVFVNETSPADFIFGSGSFTIDFWMYATANTTGMFYDGRPNSTNGLYPTLYYQGGVIKYLVNSVDRIVGTTTIPLNTWRHVALARDSVSGNTKLYLEGVQEGSTYVESNNYLGGGNFRPIIGNDGFAGANPFIGALDEFRVSKSAVRWLVNFHPPVIAYSNVDNSGNLRTRAQSEKG